MFVTSNVCVAYITIVTIVDHVRIADDDEQQAIAMMTTAKDGQPHPYLTGNFAPVKRELPLTPCTVVQGSVPAEVCGGQYVRNGGNPLKDDDEQRQAHWFDGDGMLTGVLFQRDDEKATVRPHFINRYILTDVLLSSSTLPELRRPMLPSISTFASPISSAWTLLVLLGHILRTFTLSMLSWLPYRNVSKLKRISTANTSIWWHDGQAFAACESGPPVRVLLPGLETACWWTGEEDGGQRGWAKGYGPIKMINEFTTAHPRVDPVSNELLLYHMSFVQPFVRVSVIPARGSALKPLLGAPLPGMRQPKLAHDFCATATKTIFIDLPLSLDPRNLLKGKPMLSYESTMPTRFAIFPGRSPEQARWYESEGCCIYHAANAWDGQTVRQGDDATVHTTNLVACRLNSATLVYAAGNLDTPPEARAHDGVEKCQLYYWQFDASHDGVNGGTDVSGKVLREFALSNIPFEFPTMDERKAQTANRFVYGASMTSGSFDAGLGSRCAKIDCLAKVDIASLTAKGVRLMDQGRLRAGQPVDTRTVAGILAEPKENDDIAIFSLPAGHYAQEATFVPRLNAEREDDGFLVFFVFDEHTGLHDDGRCRDDAQSQLWIVDARTMRDVVCKIKLPQRVPYGLHGHFFSEREIASQRPVSPSDIRNWALAQKGVGGVGMAGAKSSGSAGGHQRVLAAVFDSVRQHVARMLA